MHALYLHAYYCFAGKDDLVHELYLRVQDEQRARPVPRFVPGGPLRRTCARSCTPAST